MTAEVCVMNKIGVALAADSAVTLSPNGKIYASVDKLFALAENAPVGVMIYGNATFAGVPWETIFKMFRKELGSDHFETLNDYAMELISFLKRRSVIVDAELQKQCAQSLIFDYLMNLKDRLDRRFRAAIEEKGELDEPDIEQIVLQLIEDENSKCEDFNTLSDLPSNFADTVKEEYGEHINELIVEVFEDLPGIAGNDTLFGLIPKILISDRWRMVDAGLVVAGFGDREIFPGIVEFSISGMIADHLLYCQRRSQAIDAKVSACVIPFAQQEMVHTFMEGIDPSLLDLFQQATLQTLMGMAEVILSDLSPGMKNKQSKVDLASKVELAVQNLYEDLLGNLKRSRERDYNKPVMQIVSALPKDELAAMAESLVNLTKFKRRVSKQQETVAGPIDVAVISKGDGFVWIKRKHYFDAQLNPRFIARYYQGATGD